MQDNDIDWDKTRDEIHNGPTNRIALAASPVERPKADDVDYCWSWSHSLASAAIFLVGIVAVIATMSWSPS